MQVDTCACNYYKIIFHRRGHVPGYPRYYIIKRYTLIMHALGSHIALFSARPFETRRYRFPPSAHCFPVKVIDRHYTQHVCRLSYRIKIPISITLYIMYLILVYFYLFFHYYLYIPKVKRFVIRRRAYASFLAISVY